MGTTKISNPSNGKSMGWHWQSLNPTPSHFRWAINAPATTMSGLPIETNKLAPGVSETLNILFFCSPGQTFSVVMLDDYNRVYDITLAPQ
jgi:hypothetical protein